MSRFFNFSAPGAADPAGQDNQGHLANAQARQPLQRYSQPQQWPNQDPDSAADPLDGTDPVGDQDDDLEVDDDLPVDLPEAKGSEVPEWGCPGFVDRTIGVTP